MDLRASTFSYTDIGYYQALGCDLSQVGSRPDPFSSRDYHVITHNLRELADRAAAQGSLVRMYVCALRRPDIERWLFIVHTSYGLGQVMFSFPGAVR